MINQAQIHRFEKTKGVKFDKRDYDVVSYYLSGFNGGTKTKNFEIYLPNGKLDVKKLNRLFSYRSEDGRMPFIGRGTLNPNDSKTVSHVISKLEEKENISLAFLISEDSTTSFNDYKQQGEIKAYKGKRMNKKERETDFPFLDSVYGSSTILKKIQSPFSENRKNLSILIENENPEKNLVIGSIYTLPFAEGGRITDSIIIAQGKNAKRVVESITQTKIEKYSSAKKWKEISYFNEEGLPLIENSSPETTLRIAMASVITNGPLFEGYNQITLGKYKIERKPNCQFCLYERT